MADAVAVSSTADAPVAVTALDHAVVAGDVSAFREARRAERAGAPLEPSPVDPASTEPVEQAASTDAPTAPASEPGPPKKRNADSRIQELLKERHDATERANRLEAELSALKRPASVPDVAAASSPALSADAEFPDFAAWAAIAGNESKSYEQYTTALLRHEIQASRRAEQREHEIRSYQQEQQTLTETYQGRLTPFREAHADFDTVVAPVLAMPPSPTAGAMSEVIRRSEIGPALTYALGQDLAACQRLLSLPPHLAVYELGKLEASLSAPPDTPVRTITSASRPPTTLGRKTVDAVNALDAAVASGDVSAFKAEKQRQRVAQFSR